MELFFRNEMDYGAVVFLNRCKISGEFSLKVQSFCRNDLFDHADSLMTLKKSPIS